MLVGWHLISITSQMILLVHLDFLATLEQPFLQL
jgi:hypothetical protein